MRLEGKRVLVVGASSGIGKATAVELAREGARVCVAARREDRLAETVSEAGNGAFALSCDVQDEASCAAVVAGAVSEMAGLDAVVYAPGISAWGPIETVDAETWHAVFATNVIGLSLILNAAIEPLTASRGRVVVLSSITIDDSPPRPKQSTYGVTKFALERIVECWQGEHHAVGFTSIALGDTLSEFGLQEDMEKMMPIVQRWNTLEYLYGRMMEPIAIAEQVVNALAARETIRRIAVTPSYPPEEDEKLDYGEAALELSRDRGGE